MASFKLTLANHARHRADIIMAHKEVAVRGSLHVALRTPALEHSGSASATISYLKWSRGAACIRGHDLTKEINVDYYKVCARKVRVRWPSSRHKCAPQCENDRPENNAQG